MCALSCGWRLRVSSTVFAKESRAMMSGERFTPCALLVCSLFGMLVGLLPRDGGVACKRNPPAGVVGIVRIDWSKQGRSSLLFLV